MAIRLAVKSGELPVLAKTDEARGLVTTSRCLVRSFRAALRPPPDGAHDH